MRTYSIDEPASPMWMRDKPAHDSCPCTGCDDWRAYQVRPGDLCRPLIVVATTLYGSDPRNMCSTWEYDGRLLWGIKPPNGAFVWTLWENPRERCDAHLDPITIMFFDERGEMHIRVTSKRWLEVVQKGDV